MLELYNNSILNSKKIYIYLYNELYGLNLDKYQIEEEEKKKGIFRI